MCQVREWRAAEHVLQVLQSKVRFGVVRKCLLLNHRIICALMKRTRSFLYSLSVSPFCFTDSKPESPCQITPAHKILEDNCENFCSSCGCHKCTSGKNWSWIKSETLTNCGMKDELYIHLNGGEIIHPVQFLQINMIVCSFHYNRVPFPPFVVT